MFKKFIVYYEKMEVFEVYISQSDYIDGASENFLVKIIIGKNAN